MKVAIVGSRQYTNKKRIQEFVFKLKQKYGDELEIVSGGQKDGADGYAKKYALEFDINYSEFPPSHYAYNQHCVLESYKYGRPYAAWHYHDRNKKIVEYSDVVVAFIPKKLLWPAVFIFAMIGSYSFSSSMFDVWVMLTFGVIGYFMSRHGFSAAPLVMGLILGKLVEESFSQSMIIHDNNFFALLDKPIVVFFFILTFLSLTTPLWTKVFKKNSFHCYTFS